MSASKSCSLNKSACPLIVADKMTLTMLVVEAEWMGERREVGAFDVAEAAYKLNPRRRVFAAIALMDLIIG